MAKMPEEELLVALKIADRRAVFWHMMAVLGWGLLAIALVVLLTSCATPPKPFTTKNLYQAVCVDEGACGP